MFTVFTERGNTPYTHSVKSLQIIWNHFPQFSAKNTIHVDDLSRNFALNPQEGLKIHAFKNAHTPEALRDRELDKLARYMLHIAPMDDFRSLKHKDWKNIARALGPPWMTVRLSFACVFGVCMLNIWISMTFMYWYPQRARMRTSTIYNEMYCSAHNQRNFIHFLG